MSTMARAVRACVEGAAATGGDAAVGRREVRVTERLEPTAGACPFLKNVSRVDGEVVEAG